MPNSRTGSLPSLPSTVTWSLTALALLACSYVAGIWRGLERENMSVLPPGRRPENGSKETAARSGLRIVFRRGSPCISNNGSTALCGNWKPGKESTPSTTAGGFTLDRLKRHPVIQTLQSRLPQAGGLGPAAAL